MCVCWGGDSILLPPTPNPEDPASQSTQDRGVQASKRVCACVGVGGRVHTQARTQRPKASLQAVQLASLCLCPRGMPSGFHDKSEADRAASGSVIRAN